MNDTIRRLARACDAWCDRDHIDSSGWSGSAWEARFAELIVRECAEICLEANDHDNILRHFGVKP